MSRGWTITVCMFLVALGGIIGVIWSGSGPL